jgi:hypothetical protein
MNLNLSGAVCAEWGSHLDFGHLRSVAGGVDQTIDGEVNPKMAKVQLTRST